MQQFIVSNEYQTNQPVNLMSSLNIEVIEGNFITGQAGPSKIKRKKDPEWEGDKLIYNIG